MVHQTISPRKRVGSGHETTVDYLTVNLFMNDCRVAMVKLALLAGQELVAPLAEMVSLVTGVLMELL